MSILSKHILFIFVAFSLLNKGGFAMTISDYQQQDTSRNIIFHFRFDKDLLDSGYMENSTSLKELDRIISDKKIDSVVIIASGSPDGVVEHNHALAKRRAKAMKGYIIWKYPSINQYQIFTNSVGEDWVGLRRLVEADGKVPYKGEILKILSQDINPSTKEWRLKQIEGGKAWIYVTNHYLRYLRAAATCIVYYKEQEIEKTAKQKIESLVEKSPVEQIIEQPIESTVSIYKEVVAVEQEEIKEDITVVIEPTLDQPIISQQIKPVSRPLFAFKTNLLELAAGVANVGLEVRLGNKFSVDIPFAYSPYTISSDYRTRVMMLRPEVRYWFRDAFDGHFLGVHGIGGIYNVSVNSDTRYQSNRMAYGVGLSYGYAFRLSKHWGVELSLGAGYVNTAYDCYYNVPNGMLYDSRNKHYWGITRASVSIVYLINRKL